MVQTWHCIDIQIMSHSISLGLYIRIMLNSFKIKVVDLNETNVLCSSRDLLGTVSSFSENR